MNAGIIICSRLSSSRLPRKALLEVGDAPILVHLIRRLLQTELPIFIAVPGHELGEYARALGDYLTRVMLLAGPEEDPLARMDFVARMNGIDTIVRVTHDKIFVNPDDIHHALDVYEESNLDYVFSSTILPGTGFEIIDADVLHRASERFKNVEHVSYAIKAMTDRRGDVPMGPIENPNHRLLIDYPEDLALIQEIFYHCGNKANKQQVIRFLEENPKIADINRMPLVTLYTCGYNAEKWLATSTASVVAQDIFPSQAEYLLIDDGSKDDTGPLMEMLQTLLANTRFIPNDENIGLSSSCNRALGQARGKYIIRLDADDYFVRPNVVREMVAAMEANGFDVMYPDHYLGSMKNIEKGNVHHHAGGAIFSTKALNHMKFTDGLRGFEGYDLFERAKTQLKIGYFERPTFFYRQHEGSLSKEDPAKRAEIKEEITNRVTPRD